MKWHTRVRTEGGGIDAYIRVVAPDYVAAGKRAQEKAAKKFRAGAFPGSQLHIHGARQRDWMVIMVSLHSQ